MHNPDEEATARKGWILRTVSRGAGVGISPSHCEHRAALGETSRTNGVSEKERHNEPSLACPKTYMNLRRLSWLESPHSAPVIWLSRGLWAGACHAVLQHDTLRQEQSCSALITE
jgi:hypothetical protein